MNYMYNSICMNLPKLNCEVDYCLRLKDSLMVIRTMLSRRDAYRGSRRGRGRGAGRVQPEVQSVAQAINLATPVTHADLIAME